ncbi:MAG: hypothetical protein P1V34_05570 [Alphaproteobacteria bacterium]|nr:hypothetical protein [Alphaproteobacteria bacterium]
MRWRKRSTVSFTQTVSAALLVAVIGINTAFADCDDRIHALEGMMQDGLSDLTVGQSLLEEALHGSAATKAGDEQTCSFLRAGAESFEKAKAHFQLCADSLEEMLSRCKAPDWEKVSASPDLCQMRIKEIDREMRDMPNRLTRFCGQ